MKKAINYVMSKKVTDEEEIDQQLENFRNERLAKEKEEQDEVCE